METNQQVIALLEKAIALLRGTTPTPASQPSSSASDDEETLTGTIGRPEFKMVGKQQLSLFTAGLKVDGNWINLNAWRKSAAWANQNLGSGTEVKATGKFETQEWTDRDGMPKSRQVFIVRQFELTRNTQAHIQP